MRIRCSGFCLQVASEFEYIYQLALAYNFAGVALVASHKRLIIILRNMADPHQ